MIDEKKLIEALKKEISETYHDDYILALERAIEIVKDQMKVGEWIPCRERLPEKNKKVLAKWRKYYTNRHYVSILSLYSYGKWYGDLGCPNGDVVEWMPLPK